MTVQATFHVNLQHTLDVTLSEPEYVQWGASWPTLYATVQAAGANQTVILERPLVNYFAPFNETRSETVDLIIQSTVGQTITLAVQITADIFSILAARAHVHGEFSAQVGKPYLMEVNGLDVNFIDN